MLLAYEMFTSFLHKQYDNMLIFFLIFEISNATSMCFQSLLRFDIVNITDLIYVEFYFYDTNIAKMYTVVIK